MKKRKDREEKKVIEDGNKVDPKIVAAMKAIDNTIPLIDKDLAQFIACSALSTNNMKLFNTFSLCCQVYNLRNSLKANKVQTPEQKVQDDYLWLTAVDSILGSKAPLN